MCNFSSILFTFLLAIVVGRSSGEDDVYLEEMMMTNPWEVRRHQDVRLRRNNEDWSSFGRSRRFIFDDLIAEFTSRNPTSSSTLYWNQNPFLTWTSNQTLNSTLNPTLNWTRTPFLYWALYPTLNSTLNATLNSTLNPTLNWTQNPFLNWTQNPFLNWTPNPTLNSTLNTNQNATQNVTLNEAEEIKAILKKLLPKHDFQNDSALDEVIYKNYFSLPFPEKSALQAALEGNTTSPGTGVNATSTDPPTTTTTTTTATTSSTTTTPLPPPPLDLESIFREIEELTYDDESGLIKKLNESLHKKYTWGPKCEAKIKVNNTNETGAMATTGITTIALTPDYDSDIESDEEQAKPNDTQHIARCYVCGLDKEPGTPKVYIPFDTRCGDAFATDFLPMVPVDASARGHLARFRKNCDYMDVKNFKVPEKDPKTIFGRWTGGCSVRWTDLSGVYTQRTCRNKIHPVKGHHLASKRMARLELALKKS